MNLVFPISLVEHGQNGVHGQSVVQLAELDITLECASVMVVSRDQLVVKDLQLNGALAAVR